MADQNSTLFIKGSNREDYLLRAIFEHPSLALLDEAQCETYDASTQALIDLVSSSKSFETRTLQDRAI